ncbi:MAG: isoleucine--tRNA ligase [Halobacteria archaeon]
MEEVSDRYDPGEVESEVKTYWDETDAYEVTKEAHSDDPTYYFLDGPPYTSGQMHLGTAWNKTLKDVVIRYLRMQGYDVHDQPGYDMHGLPIEVKVEEKLGFENKSDIKEYGVENFIDDCKEFAETNLEDMNEDFRSMGVWMDWSDPYRTLDNSYMEGAWWAFNEAHERGLVEKGQRVINQCPRCETAIADAEVEYDEIDSPSIYVKFPLVDSEGSLVIWTTTPWTLPANLYVAVDSDLEYSRIEAEKEGDTEQLIVASECVEDVLREGRYQDYEVLEEIQGEELVGERYRHPLEDQVPEQREYDDSDGVHEVHAGDFVTADRTGLVHAAPGHGVDDFELGQDLGLPVFSPVGEDGVYTGDAGKYEGGFVRDVNPDIIKDLGEEGVLLSEGETSHRYGHCWRCDTSIIFTATDQWFINVTEVKNRLLEELDETDWYPEWARDSRFRDWVSDARDWNVSRQRYWGIPVPIWICSNGHQNCVGTKDELLERAVGDVDGDLDLHRPDVDSVEIECGECGESAERVEDIFDVWLDSSVASWATLGYPGEDQPFEDIWPADLIIEAHDQTRGWFWTQLGMSVSALDQAPYDKVVMHGHALDEDGRKMSKSLGNIVTPEEAISRYGVDPLRCFLMSHNQQGDDMRFSWGEIEDKQRTLNVFWNTYRFPLPYMKLDGFNPNEVGVEDVDLSVADRWVLSRLESTKQEVTESMEEFEVQDAQKAVLDFVTEDVSRYYIQVIRPRMWQEEDSNDKLAAYATLYRVLDESIRMLAPFAPHVAESMHQNLSATDSDGAEAVTVHATEFPEVREELIDEELENDVDVLREVEEAAANARQKAERKLRWPVRSVIVESEYDEVKESVKRYTDLLLDRANAKELQVASAYGGLTEVAEPQMDVIGPEFGADSQKVMEAVKGATRKELDGIEVDGESVEVTDDMVEFREEVPDEVESAEFSDGTVYVDVAIDEEIEAEGFAREVVRRIQEMRKQLELDVEERIEVDVAFEESRTESLVGEHREYVMEETRADGFELGEVEGSEYDSVEDWEIEGEEVRIGLTTS